MSREWKPGEFVIVEDGAGEEWCGVVVCGQKNGGSIVNVVSPDYDPLGRSLGWEARRLRPLVTIDPEDREQVERLASLLWPHYSKSEAARLCKSEVTADALREFANPTPPKPEEPTDPAARVWANGSEWAKVGPWWVTPAVNESPREWDYLVEAVGFEVLAVTP